MGNSKRNAREKTRIRATKPQPVNSEEELIALVNSARDNREVIRVVGSAHSVGAAIGDNATTPDVVLVSLGGELRSFRHLSSAKDTKTFRIGGGCYLGVNPRDEDSTWANSVNVQLDNHDCAIPILGGITQQSIAGFILTGSAGASISHGFDDIIKEIHFINGLGEKVVALRRSDEFNAVGVSMGLLGIITYVVLEVPTPGFNIKGTEVTMNVSESIIAADRDTDSSNLREALESREYFRLLWFSQKYVQRVTEWSGERSSSAEIVPYRNIMSYSAAAHMAAKVLRWSHWLLRHFPNEVTYKIIGRCFRLFVRRTSEEFNDVWYKVLPVDEEIPVSTIFDTAFTELWFPIEKTEEVLHILRSLYDDQQVAGTYCAEIYGGKSSPLWLSPSYGRDVIRVNPFWFVHQQGDPREYFSHFWDALLGVEGVRLHWGKYLPTPDELYGDTRYDLTFLKDSYPMLEKWLQMRKSMDPDQIFVTDYWRKIFHIE